MSEAAKSNLFKILANNKMDKKVRKKGFLNLSLDKDYLITEGKTKWKS